VILPSARQANGVDVFRKETSVIDEIQRKMIGHAALILFIGMLAGVGLLISLIGGLELIPGSVTQIPIVGHTDAWVRAHTGGLLNALLIMGFALALPPLRFSPQNAARIKWMLVGTGWANTLFYWAALVAPNRALTFGANRFGQGGLISVIGLGPALLFVVISLFAVGLVANQAFRTPG
jgi:hypothetical protein